jgi:hypothetical protein
MRKVKINYVIDISMAISFMIIAVTGITKYVFLEPFAGRYHQYYFLGISKYQWSVLHDYSGFLLLALIALHMILHLKWLWVTTKSFFIRNQ